MLLSGIFLVQHRRVGGGPCPKIHARCVGAFRVYEPAIFWTNLCQWYDNYVGRLAILEEFE